MDPLVEGIEQDGVVDLVVIDGLTIGGFDRPQ